ncbi:MAG: ABC transporter permease [Brumimicrobium sp.]
MHKIWLIAKRELAERIKSRSFLGMVFLGPLLVLGLIYLFLSFDSNQKQTWNVLLMDKNELFQGKLSPKEDPKFNFHFINDFVDYDEFAEGKDFQSFDLAIWINEKVLSNKHVIISYRERPSEAIQRKLVYHVERRLEEIMVEEFTDLSVKKFREIKQPLSFALKDTYDPKNEKSQTASWVGFAFGSFIVVFILLFGMTILRSVTKEKTNRIVEVLLASITPKQLLSGKIIGVGITAIIQVLIWTVIISAGLYLFRMTLFPDLLAPEMVANQLNGEISETSNFKNQSPFVELIYQQIQFGNMLLFFILFFLGGYLFYGAFFAMIGSSMGSESDGQQFIIPISLLLVSSLVAGYFVILYPDSAISTWLGFIPFTSPVVMMVELSSGFKDGDAWRLYFSLFLLFLFAFLVLNLAGRIYKNGILQFGHRVRLKMLYKWLKKT